MAFFCEESTRSALRMCAAAKGLTLKTYLLRLAQADGAVIAAKDLIDGRSSR
jgi:predicted RNA-binding protein YlxR (DUF448 family)